MSSPPTNGVPWWSLPPAGAGARCFPSPAFHLWLINSTLHSGRIKSRPAPRPGYQPARVCSGAPQSAGALEGKPSPSFVWEDASAGCRLHERGSRVGGETGEERKPVIFRLGLRPPTQWHIQAFDGRLSAPLKPRFLSSSIDILQVNPGRDLPGPVKEPASPLSHPSLKRARMLGCFSANALRLAPQTRELNGGQTLLHLCHERFCFVARTKPRRSSAGQM